MKRLLIYILLGVTGIITANGQAKEVPVFISGTDGFKSFRIPAIIRAPDGSLLAFCEGRLNGSGDFGNIKIVMKRSRDNGETWGQIQTVATNDTLQTDNAAPVVDMADPAYPKGRIFLFYNTRLFYYILSIILVFLNYIHFFHLHLFYSLTSFVLYVFGSQYDYTKLRILET